LFNVGFVLLLLFVLQLFVFCLFFLIACILQMKMVNSDSTFNKLLQYWQRKDASPLPSTE